MKTFIHNNIHAWTNTQGKWLVSDENTKTLSTHETENHVVNYLFSQGFKEEAQEFNEQVLNN